ncbi:condensin complex subunit 2 isoform X1 [Zeugodacus cucurbitae]|uniref:Condensin complex subunit 2 n=2 Tax=Zeugodacus cucurbitae TaxID=28588 RepID=A0A0A1X662_ZEUCU|nr:condensin complex subunit 2 isoform X1 [Zeugodacus cucurbitae]
MTVPTICMNSQYAKVTTTPGRTSLATTGGHWKQQQQQQVQQQQQLANNSLVQPLTVRAATVVQPHQVRAQEASTSGFVGAANLNHTNIATVHMTPTNTDTPLRRSEVGIYRDGVRDVNTNLGTPLNDDEEERRQARRRTMLQSSSGRESMFEDNETLKKCLEIYNGNKLSKDNAWSMSLIDTLSTLLDRHHKSLNNFKVAGSSLEASSKVYGLRVDSVHTDVLRMSAGLNAQKFANRQARSDDDDDDVATGGEGNADPNASAAVVNENGEKIAEKPKAKPRRTRRVVSTITKNKDTLNARLDTVPLQDPVFGKLNTIVGSINSSNRLMNNILFTTESELRLRTTFRFWDAQPVTAGCDYTEPTPLPNTAEDIPADSMDWAACDRLVQIKQIDELQLRPLHTGYVISDTPEAIPDNADNAESLRSSLDAPFEDAPFDGGNCGDGGGEHISMAFDINAECEPLPALNDQPPMLDVDYNDFEELTTEERTAINNCRGLRKAPVLLEDLRPVDATSKLEYSYRPLDKISQFWAGPSHWKFKRARPRPSTQATLQGVNNQRAPTRRGHALSKKRSKQLQFEQEFDDIFVKVDKYKARKANFHKKWDQRKLKLPTDLQLDSEMFNKFKCAPSAVVQPVVDDDDLALAGGDGIHGNDGGAGDDHFGDHDDGLCGDMGGGDAAGLNSMGGNASMVGDNPVNASQNVFGDQEEPLPSDGGGDDNVANNTVLEIATSFDGAPSQVTKIIVPFAKRAKVIDMKNLKRCCTQLINKQIKEATPSADIPQHPIIREEHFVDGMASFKDVYEHLPEILSQNMVESLSPSIAFYSVLHLANDYNLRLIPQQDLEDFKIRQLMD